MYTKTISASLLAFLAASVSAQTHTDCSPIKQECPAAPALGKTVAIDYTKGEDNSGFFKQLDGTKLEYDSNGAVFKIATEGQAPTIVSGQYILFGKVEVVLRAAPGVGIVTSVVLQSDDLDEIDWEWVGGDTKQVQTNYFSKGDTSTYDRGAFHKVDNPQGRFYKYTIDWSKESIKWQIDGATIRELKYADAKGGASFPQTPAQVRIGTWVGGSKSASKGTVEWAGGFANFDDAPFKAYYQSITVTDAQTGATSYVYGDRSGKWDSIIIKKDGSSSSPSSSSSSPSGTSKPSSTAGSTTVAVSSSVSAAASTLATAVSSASNSSFTTTGPSPSQTGSGTSGSSQGTQATVSSRPTATSAPSNSGVANLPSVALLGAAMVLGYLFL